MQGDGFRDIYGKSDDGGVVTVLLARDGAIY
jgi:hypothetical protein